MEILCRLGAGSRATGLCFCWTIVFLDPCLLYVIIQGRTKIYLELLKSHWGLDGSLPNGERVKRKQIWERRGRRIGCKNNIHRVHHSPAIKWGCHKVTSAEEIYAAKPRAGLDSVVRWDPREKQLLSKLLSFIVSFFF